MPTYLYFCQTHHEFEEYHSMSDAAKLTECPFCRKEKDISTPVQRLISSGGSRGIVELTGQDYIDKIKSDADKFKKEVYGSEKQYSNVLGPDNYQKLQTRMDRQKR